MYIIKQSKNGVVNTYGVVDISIREVFGNGLYITASTGKGAGIIDLGVYKEKSKAESVLAQLIEALENNEKIFEMPPSDAIKELKDGELKEGMAYCEHCGKAVYYTELNRPTTFSIRGNEYHYITKSPRCVNCDAEIYVPKVWEENMNALKMAIGNIVVNSGGVLITDQEIKFPEETASSLGIEQ